MTFVSHSTVLARCGPCLALLLPLLRSAAGTSASILGERGAGEEGCVEEAAPKICAFKSSEGIADIQPLCFRVLLVSFSKCLPASRVTNARPCPLEVPLGAQVAVNKSPPSFTSLFWGISHAWRASPMPIHTPSSHTRPPNTPFVFYLFMLPVLHTPQRTG